MPGLSITFATTDRPAMIEAYPAGFYCNAQATISYQLRNAAGTILRAGVANCSTTTGFDFPTSLKLRVPAGTPSETYTLFAWVSAGSPSSRYLNPSPRAEFGSLPNAAFIQAVSV